MKTSTRNKPEQPLMNYPVNSKKVGNWGAKIVTALGFAGFIGIAADLHNKPEHEFNMSTPEGAQHVSIKDGKIDIHPIKDSHEGGFVSFQTAQIKLRTGATIEGSKVRLQSTGNGIFIATLEGDQKAKVWDPIRQEGRLVWIAAEAGNEFTVIPTEAITIKGSETSVQVAISDILNQTIATAESRAQTAQLEGGKPKL